jgi:hypothetical protein
MLKGRSVSTSIPQHQTRNIAGFWLLLLLIVGCGATLWIATPPPVSVPPALAAAVQPALEESWASADSSFKASPTVIDLDNDGELEIIMVSANAFAPDDTNRANPLSNQVQVYDLEGNLEWERGTNIEAGDQFGGISAAPTVVDIDGNGDLEIVAGATDGYLYAWHHTGTPVSGWPIRVSQSEQDYENYRIIAQPAIGDIDNDDKLDVVVPLTDGHLYAFDVESRALKQLPAIEFPIEIGESEEYISESNELLVSQEFNSSPQIVDLDQDGGYLDVVIGSTNETLFIYQFSPDYVNQLPPYIRGEFYPPQNPDDFVSTPFIADIDPTVDGLEIAVGCNNGHVYLLDKDGNNLWAEEPAASATDTDVIVYSSPFVGDMDGDDDKEIIIGGNLDNKFWAWHHDGMPVNDWQQPGESDLAIRVSPTLGDVNGDDKPEIVVVGSASDQAGVLYCYAYNEEGNVVDGWPKPVYGISMPTGRPTLANIDSDKEFEVILGDEEGYIHIFDNKDPQEIATVTPTMTITPTETAQVTQTITTTAQVTQTITTTAQVTQTSPSQTDTPQTTVTAPVPGTPTPTPTIAPGNTKFWIKDAPNDGRVDSGAPGSTFILEAENYLPTTVGQIWVQKPGMQGFAFVRNQTFDNEGKLSFALFFPTNSSDGKYNIMLRGEPDPNKAMLSGDLASRSVTIIIQGSEVKDPTVPGDIPVWDMGSIFVTYLPVVSR